MNVIFQVVHSKFQDLVPKQIDDDDPSLEKPDDDAIQENTEKTRLALEKLISGKVAAAMPVRAAEKQAPAQYIRYLRGCFRDISHDPFIAALNQQGLRVFARINPAVCLSVL